MLFRVRYFVRVLIRDTLCCNVWYYLTDVELYMVRFAPFLEAGVAIALLLRGLYLVVLIN